MWKLLRKTCCRSLVSGWKRLGVLLEMPKRFGRNAKA